MLFLHKTTLTLTSSCVLFVFSVSKYGNYAHMFTPHRFTSAFKCILFNGNFQLSNKHIRKAHTSCKCIIKCCAVFQTVAGVNLLIIYLKKNLKWCLRSIYLQMGLPSIVKNPSISLSF